MPAPILEGIGRRRYLRLPIRRWWVVYLVAGLALTAAYVLFQRNILFNVVGLSSPIAIVIGIRVHRPTRPLPWLLFAAGQALFFVGDVITYNYPELFGAEIPFPSLGDPFYLGVYACLVGGLILLVRSRMPGRDAGSLIDSLIIAIGAGTISWVLLVSPIANASESTIDQKVVGMAYPLLDLVLIGMVVRLLMGAGRRSTSLYLVAAAAAGLFVTDGVYSFISVQGIVYDHSGQLEMGWAAFYLLWGAAALHPSMKDMTTQAHDAERRLTAGRLIILAGATLLAEVVHAIRDATDGDVTEPILYAASIVLFLLVVIRLSGLVQRVERTAEGERVLRQAGSSFVTAMDRDSVNRATIVAARILAGSESSAAVLSATGEAGEFQLVAADGDMANVLEGLRPLTSAVRGRLLLHDSIVAPLAAMFDGQPAVVTGFAALVPLVVRAELRGLLVVAAPVMPTRAAMDSLRNLSVQAALALESAEFAEVLANRRSQQWFASLVENASDVILVVEPDTTINFVSPACLRVLGYAPDDLMRLALSDFLHPDEQARFGSRFEAIVRDRGDGTDAIEFRLRHADGHWLNVEAIPSNLTGDPNIKGVVLNIRDVSERKVFEEQLAHQAFYDSLTGLANRALFQNRVEHAMSRRGRRAVAPSVLFIDLDDFKTVNDSLGHSAGDRLLAAVAGRLERCLRSSDTAARLGGDEFAVLIEDPTDGPSEMARRLLAALEEPFDVDGTRVQVRASIGIAAADPAASGPDAVAAVLRNADVAMYSAKRDGGGTWRAFEPGMLDASRRRLELKSALDRAVGRSEFVLHFQPIIDLATGVIQGAEALVRWQHPQRGLISPHDFVPLAEETGQIVAIGGWVLEQACRVAVEVQRVHPTTPPMTMAVNLSALQLRRPEIVDEVAAALAASGLAAGDLVLEITESVLMSDIDQTIERLQRLKDLGVQLAIDDFGTGYSSLNYLRQFPVDIVKIDRSFVDGIEVDDDQRALVAMIVELTVALGLHVVAEGIERPEQRALLTSLGCEQGQGFLFAGPMELASLVARLGEESPRVPRRPVRARPGAAPGSRLEGEAPELVA